MTQPTIRIAELVRDLYSLVAKFEEAFPGRRFTPDGHLIGSIGEVLAAHRYGIRLYPASSEAHDGIAEDGRQVQIKITQGKSVALRAEPQHLIVLRLDKTGEATEIFNGPGTSVWNSCGLLQKNGQRPITLARLSTLMVEVLEDERLPRCD